MKAQSSVIRDGCEAVLGGAIGGAAALLGVPATREMLKELLETDIYWESLESAISYQREMAEDE